MHTRNLSKMAEDDNPFMGYNKIGHQPKTLVGNWSVFFFSGMALGLLVWCLRASKRYKG